MKEKRRPEDIGKQNNCACTDAECEHLKDGYVPQCKRYAQQLKAPGGQYPIRLALCRLHCYGKL